jgi:hypothetical protein
MRALLPRQAIWMQAEKNAKLRVFCADLGAAIAPCEAWRAQPISPYNH